MDNYNFQGGNSGWQAPALQRPNYGWPVQATYPQQAQLSTNIELVTSLEEALFKSNLRNSDMLYLDQNRPLIYRVKVDVNGVKSHATLPYTLPNQVDSTPATKADIQALTLTLQEISEKVSLLEKNKEAKAFPKKKKAEEVGTDESDG